MWSLSYQVRVSRKPTALTDRLSRPLSLVMTIRHRSLNRLFHILEPEAVMRGETYPPKPFRNIPSKPSRTTTRPMGRV